MIYSQVMTEENKVYIKVDGYVSNNDIKKFIQEYKSQVKGIRTNKFNLVIEPELFDCENESDIKNICMMFYKTGYRKIYLIDPNNYIMSNIKLSGLEKRMFLKVVKIVKSYGEVR